MYCAIQILVTRSECTSYVMKILMVQREWCSVSFSSQPFTGHLSSLNTRHRKPVIYFCQVCVHCGITEDYKNVVSPKEKATAFSSLKTERYRKSFTVIKFNHITQFWKRSIINLLHPVQQQNIQHSSVFWEILISHCFYNTASRTVAHEFFQHCSRTFLSLVEGKAHHSMRPQNAKRLYV